MALKIGNEKTIAVMFGGRSSEHEISLRSAVFILKNIPLKYKIIPVGINKNGSYCSLSGTFLSTDFSGITPDDLAIIIKGSVPSAFIGRKNVKSILLPYLEDEIQKDNLEFFYESNDQKENIRILNLDASCFQYCTDKTEKMEDCKVCLN